MATPKKKSKRHPPKPKRQQATSREAIIRAKVKNLAMTFRVQGYTLRAILDAVNEACMDPDSEAFIEGYKPYKSPHAIEDMLKEGIAESVDPLTKIELRQISLAQIDMILIPALAAAAQGSVPHAQVAMAAQQRRDAMVKLWQEDDDGKDGVQEIRIVLNGNAANL
jgi:hypothetical protein